ncbi:MAG: AMP-binding protein [Syntrophorhabdaceae bacterium]|nr:AMP-binding protein [Syntrophorhabdaceae bacterium]
MAIDGFTPYRKEDGERYTRLRWWLGITWADLFNKHTDIYPEKIGLVDDMGRWTNRELRDEVDRTAIGFMNLGIQKRDRVLLQLPNWHEFIVSFLALQKIGAIIVVLVPRHVQIEINHFAKLTDPTAWIVPERYGKIDYRPIIDDVLKESPSIKHVILVRAKENRDFHRIEGIVDGVVLSPDNLKALEERRPDPDEVSQILPTGGTTGLPKLSPRTHNSYMNNVEYHGYRWEITSQDTIMVITPLGHNLAVHWGLAAALFFHARLVVIDSSKPEDICEWIEREKVTAIPTVPALIARVLQMENLHKYDLSSLKKISVGGAPSTPELVKGVEEKIGAKFINGFGSVEGTCASTKLGDPIELICGSVGKPICPYDEVKVVDQSGNELPPGVDGELVSKGPGIFTGYFRSTEEERAKLFTKDGFFRTGDQARKDVEGNIWITGRIKDIIIRGGENISAVEIESLLSGHPHIADSAVVGMPDKILGERICAFVVPRSGAIPTLQDVVSYLKDKGASVLQLPERIEIIQELPMTKVGKVDKKALREEIKKRLEEEGKI